MTTHTVHILMTPISVLIFLKECSFVFATKRLNWLTEPGTCRSSYGTGVMRRHVERGRLVFFLLAHFLFFSPSSFSISKERKGGFFQGPKNRLSLSRLMLPIPLVMSQENGSWTAPHGHWWHWWWSVKISSSPFSVVSCIHLMDLRQSAIMSAAVSLIFPREFKDVWASDVVPT